MQDRSVKMMEREIELNVGPRTHGFTPDPLQDFSWPCSKHLMQTEKRELDKALHFFINPSLFSNENYICLYRKIEGLSKP